LGSPPLPQPEGQRVPRVRRRIERRVRDLCFDSLRVVVGDLPGVVLEDLLSFVFQKKRRPAGRRQRKALSKLMCGVRGTLCAVAPGLRVVMVLMVTMAFWGAPLRGMVEGRREQVAYRPGVTGVQLRTTVPVKEFCGESWRL
jgi:hypothetical protein